ALRESGAIVLVGERAASSVGLFAALVRTVRATGATLGWVPRRAGERGALAAGALPSLLPGGRPVVDEGARGEGGAARGRTVTGVPGVRPVGAEAARLAVEAAWGAPVPVSPGRDTAAILAAAAAGDLDGVVVAGVDVGDPPDGGGAPDTPPA